MKKITITMVLIAFTVMAQAQIFLGGELGFNTSGSKFVPKDGDEVKAPRTSSFTIAPMAAYQLNEKLAVGARIGFQRESETRFKFMGGNDDLKNFTTGFDFGIFAQYTCLQFGKFSVLTEAGFAFGTANGKSRIGSNTTDLWKENSINIEIKPILAFDLNDRIRLTCQLNFLALGFTRISNRTPADSDNKTVESQFNFGINTNNVAGIGMDLRNIGGGDIVNRSHFITLGFLYRF